MCILFQTLNQKFGEETKLLDMIAHVMVSFILINTDILNSVDVYIISYKFLKSMKILVARNADMIFVFLYRQIYQSML